MEHFFSLLFRWVLKCKLKSASGWDCTWTVEDDSRLLAGVYEYGFGSWEAIKMDPSYKLMEKVCCVEGIFWGLFILNFYFP